MNFRIAFLAAGVILVSAAAQDRMPPISTNQWTPEQKKAAEELLAGPRKELNGPFIPLLRSPELMSRLQKTGEYLRFNNSVGSHISEFIILITARHWTQEFEWDAHYPLGLKAGLKAEVVNAVAEGRRPSGMAEDEEIAYDFVNELLHNQSVSDATYGRAVKKFGEKGVIDITGLAGYYTTLGMVMNVARTPLPEGSKPALSRFPK